MSLISSSEHAGIRVDEHGARKCECENYIRDICSKASQKIYVLARVAPYMDLFKRCILMNICFSSQFNYCPLIWVCHNRTKSREINRLH